MNAANYLDCVGGRHLRAMLFHDVPDTSNLVALHVAGRCILADEDLTAGEPELLGQTHSLAVAVREYASGLHGGLDQCVYVYKLYTQSVSLCEADKTPRRVTSQAAGADSPCVAIGSRQWYGSTASASALGLVVLEHRDQR